MIQGGEVLEMFQNKNAAGFDLGKRGKKRSGALSMARKGKGKRRISINVVDLPDLTTRAGTGWEGSLQPV